MSEQNINQLNKIYPVDTNEISLKELILKVKYFLHFVIIKWKILLIVMIIGTLLGYLFALKQPITYSARISYVLDDAQSTGKNKIGPLAQLGFSEFQNSNSEGVFSASNLIDLMKSRFLVQKILLNPIIFKGKSITIADYYLILENRQAGNNSYFKVYEDPEKLTFNQVILLNSIYLDLTSEKKLIFGSQEVKTNFLSIQVINKNENFAKLFCEILLDETSRFYIETKTKKAKLNIQNIQKQVDSIRKTFNNSVFNFAKASDNVYNLNPALKSKSIGPLQKNIDVQANTAALINLIASLESAKSTLQVETPLFQIIDKPIIPLAKNQVSRLKYSIFSGILTVILSTLFLIFSDLYKKISG